MQIVIGNCKKNPEIEKWNNMKLNWRQITLHLFATILIIAGFRQLAKLTDLNLVETIWNYKFSTADFDNHLLKSENFTFGERLTFLVRRTIYFSLIGLLFSSIISLTIGLKYKLVWYNSLLVLIIGFFIQKVVFKISAIKGGTDSMTTIFNIWGLKTAIILNAIFFVTLGLLIFFNKWTKKFIHNSE